MRYQLKIYENNKLLSSINTSKKRRILYFFQAKKKLGTQKYYLKVKYPPLIDCSGKKIYPINEGLYKSKQDFLLAWQCFTEK